jgi:parvulin-like peptidyl-prolyl isomerase
MPDLPVSAIPKAIAGVLKGLRPGQVVGPLRLGQELLLLRLEASTPAVLDQTMRERLLQDLLEEWMAQGDAALLAALDSSADALLAEAG